MSALFGDNVANEGDIVSIAPHGYTLVTSLDEIASGMLTVPEDERGKTGQLLCGFLKLTVVPKGTTDAEYEMNVMMPMVVMALLADKIMELIEQTAERVIAGGN